MPAVLLPASAAAFAPRSPPTVVLNAKVEPWLTATLKRTSRVKRPLNSAPQHVRCLTDTLSAASAIWTLCSLMVAKAPQADLRTDANPLVEALFNYRLIHVEAYVVHVDLVLQNEIAYKLTPETIEALIEFHRDVYTVDQAAKHRDWSDKDAQLKTMREDFVQAANRFVYRTHATALEGMEEDGAGELTCGRSEDVKDAIEGLFVPLMPPPPRVVEVVRPVPLLPSSPSPAPWWSQPTVPSSHPAPVDPFYIIPSSPQVHQAEGMVSTATTMTDEEMDASLWTHMSLPELEPPSPTPSYSPPPFVGSEGQYYELPMSMAPIPQVPFPSQLALQQCGTGLEYADFGAFDWERYPEEYLTAIY